MNDRLNVSAGQTILSPGCRAILSRQMDAPIYYPEYYMAELKAASLLQELIGTQSEVLIITGNATHAIEAALLSLLQPGEALLAVNSGIFGQVFIEVARVIGIQVDELKVPYGEAVQPEVLGKAIAQHPSIKAVSIVHVETSTGAMVRLPELAQVVRTYGKLLIVDAVSSLGATPLNMDKWGLDVIISSGQKALNAPQGLAFLALSEQAWSMYEQRSKPILGICLDLGIWREYRQREVREMLAAWRGDPLSFHPSSRIVHGPSPSGPLVFGLLGALEDLFNEGVEKVYRRHIVASRAVRQGLRALNLRILADESAAAPTVTTARLPDEVSELMLRQEIYREYGIALGAGPVEIGINSFRIGTMGRTAHPDTVLPVLAALGRTIPVFGIHCQSESGVEAAREIFYEGTEMGLWEVNHANSHD